MWLLAAAEQAAAEGRWLRALKLNGRARKMFNAHATRDERAAHPVRPLADIARTYPTKGQR